MGKSKKRKSTFKRKKVSEEVEFAFEINIYCLKLTFRKVKKEEESH